MLYWHHHWLLCSILNSYNTIITQHVTMSQTGTTNWWSSFWWLWFLLNKPELFDFKGCQTESEKQRVTKKVKNREWKTLFYYFKVPDMSETYSFPGLIIVFVYAIKYYKILSDLFTLQTLSETFISKPNILCKISQTAVILCRITQIQSQVVPLQIFIFRIFTEWFLVE